MTARDGEGSAWLSAAVWSLAIGVAVVGVVLAVVLSSFWPLLAFAGLAVPMMPVGVRRGAGRRASGAGLTQD
ncbi:hypothetical protein H9651_05670 [Microbacterium sp. Sa4CUA7]|uniref:Integral membrane protein n=1 Tax=Microbacterium pullorum TaxID=2762236 RepID=A0ABR8S0W0_9MICO|nr:hypothetical protein [Microbacterium pullorum]MBD7957117.1 hypothetical protein [Microbacterium pullorum]